MPSWFSNTLLYYAKSYNIIFIYKTAQREAIQYYTPNLKLYTTVELHAMQYCVCNIVTIGKYALGWNGTFSKFIRKRKKVKMSKVIGCERL